MNNKGQISKIFVAILIILLGLALYLLFANPNFSDEIESLRKFFETIAAIVFGLGAFFFLYKTKFFGLLK
jgi:hypothetical protein